MINKTYRKGMSNHFFFVIYRSNILSGITRIYFHKKVSPPKKNPQKPGSVRGPTDPGLKAAPRRPAVNFGPPKAFRQIMDPPLDLYKWDIRQLLYKIDQRMKSSEFMKYTVHF